MSANSDSRSETTIDLAELQVARQTDKVAATLHAAAVDGMRTEREGRQRWKASIVPAAHTVDLAELQEARNDEKVRGLVAAAEADGARVEREQRQRW